MANGMHIVSKTIVIAIQIIGVWIKTMVLWVTTDFLPTQTHLAILCSTTATHCFCTLGDEWMYEHKFMNDRIRKMHDKEYVRTCGWLTDKCFVFAAVWQGKRWKRAQTCTEFYEIQEARAELFVSLCETESLEVFACEESEKGIINREPSCKSKILPSVSSFSSSRYCRIIGYLNKSCSWVFYGFW